MQSTESTTDIDLQKYWLILRRRWLPAVAVFGSVVGLAVIYTFLQKPIYQAQGKLLFENQDRTSSLTGVQGEDLTALSKTNNPVDTEAEVIVSIPLMQRTITLLNLKDQEGAPLNPTVLAAMIKAKGVIGTDVLEVFYQSTSPEETAAVVNQLMNLYLENQILASRAQASTALKFVTGQLPRSEASVRQAEVALRSFKEKNNIVDLAAETASTGQVIAQMEERLAQARVELGDATAQSGALRNVVGTSSQKALTASSLSQSPGVQKALGELQDVERQLAVERTRYQEEHPVIADLKSQEAALKAQLQTRVGQVVGGQQQEPDENLQVAKPKQDLTQSFVDSEVRRLVLAKQVAALGKERAAYEQRGNVLPRLDQEQRELTRQLDAAQSTYQTLLQKLQQIRLAENQDVDNARIIEEALVPVAPVAPRKAVNLAAGGLVGILLALATAFVLEALDGSIKTVKAAREVLGYTLLGVIPSFDRSRKNIISDDDSEQSIPAIVVRDAPCSPVSEAYRMLQANLKFLSSDKQLKVVVVTSSLPQEGKSTVSANLAVAMAQSGCRVLLVDADLRRPRQRQIWDLLNEIGLSNVLIGQAELRTAIKEVMPSLHVLTAGAIPPNPGNLLDSKHMATLIKNFPDSYDFVIIDTPSLSSAADAPILGKMADGILLVVRPGVVDSGSANSAKEILEQSGQNVLGQVINGVIGENEPYSYYHYAKEYHAEDFPIPEKVGSGNIAERS